MVKGEMERNGPGLAPGTKELSREKVTGKSQLKAKATLGLQSLRSPQALLSPNVANLRPVQQLPAVGSLVTPAHIPWVSPQQSHLIWGVASMPQGIPEVFTWARH